MLDWLENAGEYYYSANGRTVYQMKRRRINSLKQLQKITRAVV